MPQKWGEMGKIIDKMGKIIDWKGALFYLFSVFPPPPPPFV